MWQNRHFVLVPVVRLVEYGRRSSWLGGRRHASPLTAVSECGGGAGIAASVPGVLAVLGARAVSICRSLLDQRPRRMRATRSNFIPRNGWGLQKLASSVLCPTVYPYLHMMLHFPASRGCTGSSPISSILSSSSLVILRTTSAYLGSA